MHLTVEEALRIYPLSRSRVAAGAEGCDRVIRSVNMMDAPDVVNWIKPGEMLFTTAFAIKDTPEDFLKLLLTLNERGSSGLGIKLGRYWNQIPPIVIEEANRLNFPLLELPYEFTFADQMNALVQAEIEKSTKKLHDALDKQKNLMRFAMQPGESSLYFQRVGEILSHPIAIVGARGQILYSTSGWKEDAILKDWPWVQKFDKSRTAQGWRCSVPLTQDGECSGYLLVMPHQAAAIQEEEGLFHQAAEILSFHMDRFQDNRLSVADYRWTLLFERYLRKKIAAEQFLEQTRMLKKDFDAAAYLCVRTVTATDSPSTAATHKGLRKIRRELMYHPYLANLGSYHLFLDGEMVSLFTLPPNGMPVPDFLRRVVDGFEEAICSFPEYAIRSYVSKPKLRLTDTLEACEECEQAKELGERLSLKGGVILFSDLELNSLFRHIPKPTMEKYGHNLMMPLFEKGDDYAEEMLRTLEAYFANEGNVNAAAKELFIHRNTVLYRLEKVSELLGVDLRKIGDLLRLKLALLFRQLMRAGDEGRQ
ncbi:PucR family transcriptional regulator [Paenibacillaceae bacterium WGS1546]|uniref:PucR family transcriptional regulator n=1 Tax=Cohnella sp. WGS1546 TaxID=3366810 RepID=UPI00372D2B3F